MELIEFKELPDESTPASVPNINNNFKYLDTAEEITNQITFNETVTGNTHFYKRGKEITVFIQGESKTHSASDVIVSNIPSGYRPEKSLFVPFIKNNAAYGILQINSNGTITVNTISSTSATGRIYASFVYYIGS